MRRRVGLPLAELRRQVAEADGEQELVRWVRALRRDSRAGARALRESAARALRARRAERRRMERLLSRRRALQAGGVRVVAGLDEVGVGPLAGPVVAAAVILPDEVDLDLEDIDDSKRLPREIRERLDAAIRARAVAVGLGAAAPHEIDRLNIYHAAQLAMRRAVARLAVRPEHVLVDGRPVRGLAVPHTAVPHGDAEDVSIAAASIVAKVHRDGLMRRFDAEHPGYGFARHVGYATAEHLAALRRLGPSPIHRRSFAPCR